MSPTRGYCVDVHAYSARLATPTVPKPLLFANPLLNLSPNFHRLRHGKSEICYTVYGGSGFKCCTWDREIEFAKNWY